jgi:hypothetical protein
MVSTRGEEAASVLIQPNYDGIGGFSIHAREKVKSQNGGLAPRGVLPNFAGQF